MSSELLECCWKTEDLGECIAALVRHARLSEHADIQELPRLMGDPANYIERAAERLGCESSVLSASLGDLEDTLRSAIPGLVRLSEHSFAACIGITKSGLVLLCPDLRRRNIPMRLICQAIREPFAGPQRTSLTELLSEDLGSVGKPALEAIVLDRIRLISFRDCWILKACAGAKPAMLLRQAAVLRNATALIGAHLAQYCIWLLAWIVMGRMSLSGRIDRATLMGWALLVATAVPFQLLNSWLQGLVAVGAGGALKKRLLAGALKLRPDEVREAGIGAFLAQALEAETVEQLAMGGGIAGLLSLIDLVVAGMILGRHCLLLALWVGFLVLCGRGFVKKFGLWTVARFRLTELTTEGMIGHRTRLTQQKPENLHTAEDIEMHRYHQLSAELDRAGVVLISVIPRGWLVLGIASILPSVLGGAASDSRLASLVGGVLLAYNALSQIAWSFGDVAAMSVGWRSIAALFQAAARPNATGALLETPNCHPSANVIEADRITFRYRSQGVSVLQNCSVTVRARDRVLLEGPSGGGKTTLASVLAGVREPESGLLLSGGLDKATLGSAGWARRVISVPQFHENHILTETLAFNLLLGRNWPPTNPDLKDADEVCRRLGLGVLLDRMPNGLLQMVGEGGWQLSHGEKTRIYMARALLHSSDLLILDESFGALDPENMHRCLEYTLERANALMVIAHP